MSPIGASLHTGQRPENRLPWTGSASLLWVHSLNTFVPAISSFSLSFLWCRQKHFPPLRIVTPLIFVAATITFFLSPHSFHWGFFSDFRFLVTSGETQHRQAEARGHWHLPAWQPIISITAVTWHGISIGTSNSIISQADKVIWHWQSSFPLRRSLHALLNRSLSFRQRPSDGTVSAFTQHIEFELSFSSSHNSSSLFHFVLHFAPRFRPRRLFIIILADFIYSLHISLRLMPQELMLFSSA